MVKIAPFIQLTGDIALGHLTQTVELVISRLENCMTEPAQGPITGSVQLTIPYSCHGVPQTDLLVV